MDAFFRVTALVLVTLILTIFLGKWEKGTAILLSIAGCCIAGAAAVSYLEPVLDLLKELETIGQLQNGMLSILIKAVGITFVAELAVMICNDAGTSSLGKLLQILSSGAVVYLSVPIFQSVLNLLTEIIGEL